jgi:phosphatidylserine synthase
MSKLSTHDKFIDLSDYGRPLGTTIAQLFKNTRVTPVHITLLFGVSGLVAAYCIFYHHYFAAGFFIILKSIIDAADGELARIKKTPSYTGRYLDSLFDLGLNFIFCLVIYLDSTTTWWVALLAFCALELQGTLYNYYYVILRTNADGGDKTSKIFENEAPVALPGEKQKTVNLLFKLYTMVYGPFDAIIHFLDSDAFKVKRFPNWFMTFVSMYGLGFQLLLIAFMLALNLKNFILPFLCYYSIFIFMIIGIRKVVWPAK